MPLHPMRHGNQMEIRGYRLPDPVGFFSRAAGEETACLAIDYPLINKHCW